MTTLSSCPILLEINICHQQHNPVFFFHHSSREIYLWGRRAQVDGTETCVHELAHKKSENWFKQKEKILGKRSMPFIVVISERISWMHCLQAVCVLGQPCLILLSFKQMPAPWKKKNQDTHFAVQTIIWFSIQPPPVQQPLFTWSCQQFRKQKRRNVKSVPNTCKTRLLLVQVHMPQWQRTKTIPPKSHFA